MLVVLSSKADDRSDEVIEVVVVVTDGKGERGV